METLTWRERLVRDSVKIRQAERLSMLQKLMRQGGLVRRLVRKTQDGTIGQSTAEPEDGTEDVIQLGDNHYQQAAPRSGMSAAAAALLTLALVAGGTGAGAALIPLVTALLNRPAATATESSTSSTTDQNAATLYDLRLVDSP